MRTFEQPTVEVIKSTEEDALQRCSTVSLIEFSYFIAAIYSFHF